MVGLAKDKQIQDALLYSSKLDDYTFEATASAALGTLSLGNIERLRSSCRANLRTKLLSVLYRGITVDLPDSRVAGLQHKVSRLFVPAGKGTLEKQLKELLKPKEFKSLTAEFDLSGKLRGLNELAHFWNSAHIDYITSNGHTFADNKVAVLYCARLVKRARDLRLDLTKLPCDGEKTRMEAFNKFSEAERRILHDLKFEMTRLRSGALCIDEDGYLNPDQSRVYGRSYNVTLSSPGSSQSE